MKKSNNILLYWKNERLKKSYDLLIDFSCIYLVNIFLQNDIKFHEDPQVVLEEMMQFPQDLLYQLFVAEEVH